MRPDPLPTLLRLRRMEMDTARAEMLNVEARVAEAQLAVQTAEAAIRHEIAMASDIATDDAAVEAFSAWLPVGRATLARAAVVRGRAEEDVLHARTMFNLARIAAEAVETLIEENKANGLRTGLQRQQAVLDDISGVRRRRT